MTDLPEPVPFPITRAGVVGAGTMGSGIALTFAAAGIPVRLIDAAPQALERARAAIERIFETARAKGRLSESDVAVRRERLAFGGDLPSLAGSDIVVEAIFESLELKRAIFAELDAHLSTYPEVGEYNQKI